MTGTAPGELRPDDDRCAVRFERLYDVSAGELWAALTEPPQLAGWLAPVTAFEPAVGGRVLLDFGEGGEVHGEILELEHERLLEYTWRFPGEDESVLRFELQPRAGGTLLVLDHRRLNLAAGAGYAAGWQAHLEALGREYAFGDEAWQQRYESLLPAYREQAAALGWQRRPAPPVREALYRGDRAAAEAAAVGVELDVFDAAALGRSERLAALLEAEPERAHSLSDDGFTPLHLACFGGSVEAVRLLVEHGAPLERLAESSIARVRPLATAAFARQLECARELLRAGADPDGAGENGFVPLHTAAQNGDAELARLLLAHGADPRRATADGRTPLDLARAAGAAECVRLLGASAAARV